jgi:hypothetical protein
VHAGIISKGLEDFSTKFWRERIFKAVEEKFTRFSTLKHLKGRCSDIVLLVDNFHQRHTCSFHRSAKEELDG